MKESCSSRLKPLLQNFANHFDSQARATIQQYKVQGTRYKVQGARCNSVIDVGGVLTPNERVLFFAVKTAPTKGCESL